MTEESIPAIPQVKKKIFMGFWLDIEQRHKLEAMAKKNNLSLTGQLNLLIEKEVV